VVVLLAFDSSVYSACASKLSSMPKCRNVSYFRLLVLLKGLVLNNL